MKWGRCSGIIWKNSGEEKENDTNTVYEILRIKILYYYLHCWTLILIWIPEVL